MTRSIYYIADDEDNTHGEEVTSAKAMAALNNITEQPFFTGKTGLFGSPEVTKAPKNILNEIILLAHTDSGRPPSTIGERTPQELADDFAKMFSNNSDRKTVTDIFLISCEAGMGSPSLAQQFAAAMKEKGFSNFKIHAVAHPEGRLIGGNVEVTTRAGKLTGGIVGQVTGYYYGTQESKDYHDYKAINAIRKSNRTPEENQLLANLAPRFEKLDPKTKKELEAGKINLVTDLEDMREFYNTFTAQGPMSMISADMAITLSFLKQRKNTLLGLDNKNVADAIDHLTQRLKEDPSLTHHDIIALFEHSLTPKHQLGLFSRVKRAVGVDEVAQHIQGCANELNQQLNAINDTDIAYENITEETPLLGESSSSHDIVIQLRAYAEQRRDEPWGFSWDLLYLKTFSFWLSDCVTSLAKNIGIIEHSTHYLDIKHRETKVSAAEKLANIIEGRNNTTVNELTPAEIGALREGRLHSIANANGDLDSYLQSENTVSPMHKKNN
jgi:hypothetical protein